MSTATELMHQLPSGDLRGPIYCDGEDAWQPGCGFCGTCGKARPIEPKPGHKTAPRWTWFCSTPCMKAWRRNHHWDIARKAALRRDRRCRKCGSDGGKARHRDARDRGLEVNHITPLADVDDGGGHVRFKPGSHVATKYRTSCAHHLDGLQVLCKPCHREETNKQRVVRMSSAGSATAIGQAV
jgi:hypothetical protein